MTARDRQGGPLFTDLYELTMAAVFFQRKMFDDATFSLFVRSHPARNYLVAAGLEDVIRWLSSFRFTTEDLEYLESTRLFKDAFLAYLSDMRFTGTVLAMPEASICFANEPLLEITAPLPQAQIIETFALNTIGFQTLIATKASRCIQAAKGRALIDFSFRRTHGLDAGVKTARSAYLAGFAATSNLIAGNRYHIPVSGTMAHSFVGVFENERKAFQTYAEQYPEKSIFLIDTYDTIEGAKAAVDVALDMRKNGTSPMGVRIDSGDVAGLSKQVRRILDDAGLHDVKIVVSSGFDEFGIEAVLSEGARIDAFGVGTKLGVCSDMPFLEIVYKLVKYAGRNIRKWSPGKATLAGEKQVYRIVDPSGRYVMDIIGTRDELPDQAFPMLETVMENGKQIVPSPDLETIRKRFQDNYALLDESYKSIHPSEPYPVSVSESLQTIQKTNLN